MNIPEDFSYSKEHIWVRPAEGETWIAGITDYAQDLLGDIVYIEPPAVGTTLIAGNPCGLVESVKTGSDLHAPLDGLVVAINENMQTTPELINETPYTAWIFRFAASNSADIKTLLDAKSYREIIGD